MTIKRVMITTDDPKTIEPVEKSPRGRSSDFPICPLVPLSCSRRRRRSLSITQTIDIDLFKLYAGINRSYKHSHKINQRPFNTFTSVTIVSVDLRCMIFGRTRMIYLPCTRRRITHR